MDAEVARLAREERLVEAAELASARGDLKDASALFERACDFRRAAEHAVRAADWGRALPLALEGKATDIAERVLPELVRDAPNAERVAFHLERRGDHGWAGRLLEGIGKSAEAAKAYERAGDAVASARLHEAANDVIGAAKVLEAQVRREPGRASLLVALGSLLHRFGKSDAAVRALQKVPASAPERREALSILVEALGRLGLAQARAIAEQELGELGGPALRPEIAAPTSVRARLFGRYEIVREVASSPHARVIECIDGVRSEKVAVRSSRRTTHAARAATRSRVRARGHGLRAAGSPEHRPRSASTSRTARRSSSRGWAAARSNRWSQRSRSRRPARWRSPRRCSPPSARAHRLGIIHRDVKPANVLFDEAGVTRLGDFGVAHLSDLSATATAGVIGTLGYMSRSSARADRRRSGAISSASARCSGRCSPASGRKREWTSRTSGPRPSGVHRDLDARHDAACSRSSRKIRRSVPPTRSSRGRCFAG